MKRIFKKFGKSKKKNPSQTIADVPPSEPISTMMTSAAYSIHTNASTVSLATTPTTVDELVSDSVPVLATNDLAPKSYLKENRDNSPDAVMQANLGPVGSEQNLLIQHSGSGSPAKNVLITGGTFINYIPPVNASEGQMKIPMKIPMRVPVYRKPNSSTRFTGRKNILDKLGKVFVPRANGRLMSRRSCLLWGMGGIGKTQICLKFIEEMSDSFSYVFWVDASSHKSITMSLKGISSIPAAQESGMDGSVESVLHWISYMQEEWLMVFDNADDPPPGVVAKFIPPGNRGNILITSRNRSMGRIISFENCIEIIEMEEPDAVTLLLKASCLDHSAEHLQAAKEIVIELGCIPLAVDHAGAYIKAGKCTIQNYLWHFFLHRQTLMSDAVFMGASGYNQTVYGTWDLSLKEIEKRARGQSTTQIAQAAQAAILILQICAFYDHSNISKDIFQSAAEESRKCAVDSKIANKLPQSTISLDPNLLALDNDGTWDDFIFVQGIEVLLSFSLMKRQSSEILSIHPLMHCWSREQMSETKQKKMCQMASIILCYAIPWRFESEDYALRRLIFPHIKACELHGTQMGLVKQYYQLKNFALVMRENGDWNNAEQLEVQVMDMNKKLLGTDHPNTLTSMANLASTYWNQGRWSEAEQLEVEVMEMSRKVLGVEHPDTLKSMANLASTYYNQGRLNEAEQLNVQVMDMNKKILGAEHPDTLTGMANLASIYWDQGRWNEAEQLEVQVMDMSKKLLGAEHPSTLTSMANLASTYYNQGRLHEAEQLNVQVMEMSRKVLGVEHPDTLKSMANLASTYYNQGRLNEAEQLNVQVMDMNKKILGAEHPDTLTSMANLASTYWDQGRWNEAEQLEVQVMNMSKKVFGSEHPSTLTSMANLASTYYNQGRLNEAEQLGIQVMDIRKKLLGSGHPDTLISMEILANIYHNQGLWNEAAAEQLELNIMNIRKRGLPSQSKLDEPNQAVDQNSGINLHIVHPQSTEIHTVAAAQVLIAAEGALKHVSDLGRKSKIEEAFLDLQIVESQYIVLAGFNEALIQSGFGYLEEIHMFCSVEIPDSPLLLIRLGKILSPYPGIIFTPSSGYKTPVFKDDGTIWDYDDLCLHHAETVTHSNLHIKEILHSKLNTFTASGGQPSIYVAASGCPEGGNDDKHGRAGEDKGNGHDVNPDHSNSGDDPDDPDAGNGDSSTPGISFAAQAKLFKGAGKSSSSEPFQVLEINGRLVVQTVPGRLKPKRIQSKSHVEFRKLNFQSMKSDSLGYEQVYVEVKIDTKDKNTEIDVLQPLKTPAFDQETKEIIANKVATSGTGTVSMGLLTPAPTVSFAGNRLKETSSSTEIKKYHSRITEANSDGAVSWGFSVDDANERQTGIELGTRHRAHPSVDFKFYGEKDDGPPPLPPKHFDVLVRSCWSLISGNEGYTTSGWFSLFKGLGLTGTAASKATLYSNLCQVIILEVPSNLSQETFHKSVSEVNQSSSETVVTRPGLYKITSTVLFLGGRPIESGNSYGTLLLR